MSGELSKQTSLVFISQVSTITSLFSDDQNYLSIMFAERGDSGSFWIDLSNEDDRNTFKFSDGRTPPMTYWASGNPSKYHLLQSDPCLCLIYVYCGPPTGSYDDPSYVMMHIDDHGKWRNIPVDHQHNFVCEMEREGYTPPTVSPTQPPSGSCAVGWKQLGSSFCIQVIKVARMTDRWNHQVSVAGFVFNYRSM